jgi:hypothetical protein
MRIFTEVAFSPSVDEIEHPEAIELAQVDRTEHGMRVVRVTGELHAVADFLLKRWSSNPLHVLYAIKDAALAAE